jgi:ribosomal protein S18 acetylase RimI-like enzyme
MAAINIAPLRAADRPEWEALARGYKAFYETELPDARYEETWRALIGGDRVHGLAARIDGHMVGIAHYLLHAQTWGPDACYLQDLFTAPEARGRGVATALVDAVAADARARGAAKYYWLTKEGNLPARALYDRIAAFKGFLRYDYRL